ncbi:MAG: hypothetical protein L6Q71_06640 [Planctomycetes bacterium]|nr:hypothetical protein [Planctomycetota bacterium]NUQ33546.1 hypothetical protein [Planctomycetaceae bacterium]
MANSEQPGPNNDATEKADMIARIEAELSRRQDQPKKKATAAPAKFREGVYMLIFEVFLIFMFGGIYGRAIEQVEQTGARKGGGFWEERLRDLREISGGFTRQLGEMWAIEAGLMATALLVAFAIRNEKPRRRFFALLVAATMTILSLKVFTAMMGNIR